MKLFYFFTNEPDIINLKNIFEQSIPEDIELRPLIIDDISFCKKDRGGGYNGWLSKYSTIMKGFAETAPNEYFIFSDIDVIFYNSFLSDIKDIIKNEEDILFQMENIGHDVNIGFMLIKNTEKCKLFWNKAYNIIENIKYTDKNGCEKIKHRRGDGSGQFIINDIIYGSDPIVKWSRLPSAFWSRSIGWDHLNKDIYIHHANCTYSVDQKINQITDIQSRISNNSINTKYPTQFGGASISKEEYNIIIDIIHKFNIKTILEFGPGTSTVAFAENNCEIISIENNKEFLDKNKNLFKSYPKIEFFLNNQSDIIQLKNKLKNKLFDLCFIDGPRADSQQYKLFNRIDSYIFGMLHANYILAHDTKRFKDRNSINLLFDPEIYNIEELPSDRGLTLIYKKHI